MGQACWALGWPAGTLQTPSLGGRRCIQLAETAVQSREALLRPNMVIFTPTTLGDFSTPPSSCWDCLDSLAASSQPWRKGQCPSSALTLALMCDFSPECLCFHLPHRLLQPAHRSLQHCDRCCWLHTQVSFFIRKESVGQDSAQACAK